MKYPTIIGSLIFALTVPAAAADFTGPRVEVRTGWDHVALGNNQGSDDGIAYGLGAGYDFAITENIIAGPEVGIDFHSTKECTPVLGNDELCAKFGRDLSIGGRIGTPVADNILVFASAAYTNARVKATYEDFDGILPSEKEGANADGVRFGGGAEIAFDYNMYAKAEYRYSNYEAGLSRHQILAGVGIRF
jgi:outer membrane immunogenic protein